MPVPYVRIPPDQRKFSSPAIEAVIIGISSRMRDQDLANLFVNCYPNTLDTTVSHRNASIPDTFIITGDIDAQWLRDSTNQVLPYIPYAPEDPALQNLICGLIQRQSRDILHDSYANAFNYEEEGGDHQSDIRKPNMTLHVFEGKYELDSLAAAMKLSYAYYNYTHDVSCFDSTWLDAQEAIIQTITDQQKSSEEEGDNYPYRFQRLTTVATDTLMLGGRGPMAARTGMSKCAFRGSDDAVSLPFLVPSNAMTVVELRHLATILTALGEPLATAALELADEIDGGIQQFVITQTSAGPTLAYEVDGFGSMVLMDDANIPSLLSLPYLGYLEKSNALYTATRKFVLSASNPFFFTGSAGEGIGGPHVGMGYIWPMSIIMRALTSDDDAEITQCLEDLKESSVGTGFLHESFWKDDVTQFTRTWFAWCNSLFGELILTLARERPHLIF